MDRSRTAGAWVGHGLAVGVFLFLLFAGVRIDQLQRHDSRLQARETVKEAVGQIRARVEAEISARIAIVDSLGSFALAVPTLDAPQFSVFAEDMMHQRAGIRALQLAPQARITFVHPLAGNEAALGHDLLTDPVRVGAARQAIDQRRAVVAGPYELRQGGLGAVARKPIFGGDGFWGLAIVVLDIPALLEQAGLAAPVLDRLVVAIRGKDGEPEPTSIFFGDAAVFQADPVLQTIAVGAGRWQIAALPVGGWPSGWPGRPLFLAVAGVVALLGLGLGVALARQTQTLRRSAKEATAARAKLQTLFDESLQFIGTLTPNGLVTSLNRAAADLIGRHPDELIGAPFWETPWWSHESALAERLRQGIAAAAAGEVVHFEATHRCAEGGVIWVDFSLKPLRDQHGVVTQLIAEGRDITERRMMEQLLTQNEALYHEMFLTNTALKLLIDPDSGVIVDANDAAIDFYGYPRENLIGMPVGRINTLDEAAVRHEMEAARCSQRRYFRFAHRLASGEVRDVEVYSGPVTRGGRTLLHSIIHDVTDRVRLEEELRRSNAELEQFAYAASHDLREPLRMVSSFVALFLRRYGARIDDTGRELLGFAEDGAKRMDLMIVDLLEYSRVGRLERPMRGWPLRELIDAAMLPLTVAIAEAKAEVSVPAELPAVNVSREETVRVLTNLIGNAVKYRRLDVACAVRIGAERVGDKVVLSVADNGIGIAPEYFDRVFLLFQRLHGRDQYEGTGIGLALVKKVAERHGGKVWVESAGESQGATFYVSLPAG